MTREEIFKQLESIFKDVLDLETVTLCDSTTAADIEEWDSLNHVQLVYEVEQAMGIRFTSAEILAWKNVGQMVDSIIKHRQ